jgi:hypothetical protein
LSSRSFRHLFHSQQFWASRVKAERPWLFEIGDGKDIQDWRWLYHRTNDRRIGNGLRNRRRVWSLIADLKTILQLRWRELPADLSPAGQLDSRHEWEWLLVAGNLLEQPEGLSQLEEGCVLFKKQKLRIAGHISGVSASTVRVGSSEYIAGISLTNAAGEVVRLGYSNDTERSVQLDGLAGFRLAVGLRGIHAIQCIDAQTREPSAWLGSPDDTPKTERAITQGEILAIGVGFDVRNPSTNHILSIYSPYLLYILSIFSPYPLHILSISFPSSVHIRLIC